MQPFLASSSSPSPSSSSVLSLSSSPTLYTANAIRYAFDKHNKVYDDDDDDDDRLIKQRLFEKNYTSVSFVFVQFRTETKLKSDQPIFFFHRNFSVPDFFRRSEEKNRKLEPGVKKMFGE